MRSNKVDAIRCSKNNKVDISNKSTSYLQQRNKHLMAVLKGSKIETDDKDLRLYLKINEKNECVKKVL